MRQKKKRMVGLTTTYEAELVDRMDEYIDEHNLPSYSALVREAVASYLDHNQTVSIDSKQDSEPIETIDQPIESTPETDDKPKPDDKPKNDNGGL